MPGIALVVLVTAAGIVGDRIRDILDPRSVTR
jgi:ABC-type dipeptide/oligopeptide/nickel transport system permease subunit